MIPLLMTVRYRRANRRWRRLYIPVLPVALVLAPLLVLAGLAACIIFRINVGSALQGVGRPVWALPGTRFEVADSQMAVLVSIR